MELFSGEVWRLVLSRSHYAVEHDGKDDDGAEGSSLPKGIYANDVQSVLEDPNEENTDECAEHTSSPSHE
jgi:hypothetical protein